MSGKIFDYFGGSDTTLRMFLNSRRLVTDIGLNLGICEFIVGELHKLEPSLCL
jgi:DNA modification methylase